MGRGGSVKSAPRCYIKNIYLSAGINWPATHSLTKTVTDCPIAGVNIPHVRMYTKRHAVPFGGNLLR